jgi:hypothetical protein
MSPQSKLFNELLKATRRGDLSWSYSSSSRYEDFVYQPQSVFRAFETIFNIQNSDYRVFLVEKKYPDADWDFSIEKYRPELYFLSGRSLVLTINDDFVELPKFGELVHIVESSTDEAKRLLGL